MASINIQNEKYIYKTFIYKNKLDFIHGIIWASLYFFCNQRTFQCWKYWLHGDFLQSSSSFTYSCCLAKQCTLPHLCICDIALPTVKHKVFSKYFSYITPPNNAQSRSSILCTKSEAEKKILGYTRQFISLYVLYIRRSYWETELGSGNFSIIKRSWHWSQFLIGYLFYQVTSHVRHNIFLNFWMNWCCHF